MQRSALPLSPCTYLFWFWMQVLGSPLSRGHCPHLSPIFPWDIAICPWDIAICHLQFGDKYQGTNGVTTYMLVSLLMTFRDIWGQIKTSPGQMQLCTRIPQKWPSMGTNPGQIQPSLLGCFVGTNSMVKIVGHWPF